MLKRTPLFSEYDKYGGKTIDFGGWELPVQFSGIKHEHEVTRTKAGVFDVSHMGEILVKGPKSYDFLQYMLTNDLKKLTPKRAQYTFMCNERGGTIDDLIVYMIDENHYLLVVNAANTEKDFAWLKEHNDYKDDEVMLENVSDQYIQLAVQGPKAQMILNQLTETNLEEIKFFRFDDEVYFSDLERPALVSRTGYTGEDGFEIYISPKDGVKLWNLILEKGKDMGVEPVGLGARDTLRFEAGLPLYGQELAEDISPIEAGLSFAVKVKKEEEFIGKAVLAEQMEKGTTRKLVGIEMIDKGIPRHGYKVWHEDKEVGVVTSGTQSPTLKKNVGMVLVQSDLATPGTELSIQVRKRNLKANVCKLPFYQRQK